MTHYAAIVGLDGAVDAEGEMLAGSLGPIAVEQSRLFEVGGTGRKLARIGGNRKNSALPCSVTDLAGEQVVFPLVGQPVISQLGQRLRRSASHRGRVFFLN